MEMERHEGLRREVSDPQLPPNPSVPSSLPTPPHFRGDSRPLCNVTVTWRGLVGAGRESTFLAGGWVWFFLRVFPWEMGLSAALKATSMP